MAVYKKKCSGLGFRRSLCREELVSRRLAYTKAVLCSRSHFGIDTLFPKITYTAVPALLLSRYRLDYPNTDLFIINLLTQIPAKDIASARGKGSTHWYIFLYLLNCRARNFSFDTQLGNGKPCLNSQSFELSHELSSASVGRFLLEARAYSVQNHIAGVRAYSTAQTYA